MGEDAGGGRMTENEAIKRLKVLTDYEYDEDLEALDMAIKALEQQIIHGITYGGVSWGGTYTFKEQQSCEDCISREDAINKIEEWANGFEEGGYFSGKSVADAIRACGGIIAELPPVRPKYTDEEIDRAQAVEQAYIDKMVELVAEEAKRPKGKWEYVQYDYNPNIGNWHCSECRFMFVMSGVPEYKYCPNCGAKMIEPQESEDKK